MKEEIVLAGDVNIHLDTDETNANKFREILMDFKVVGKGVFDYQDFKKAIKKPDPCQFKLGHRSMGYRTGPHSLPHPII